jgi:hypothetical protein
MRPRFPVRKRFGHANDGMRRSRAAGEESRTALGNGRPHRYASHDRTAIGHPPILQTKIHLQPIGLQNRPGISWIGFPCNTPGNTPFPICNSRGENRSGFADIVSDIVDEISDREWGTMCTMWNPYTKKMAWSDNAEFVAIGIVFWNPLPGRIPDCRRRLPVKLCLHRAPASDSLSQRSQIGARSQNRRAAGPSASDRRDWGAASPRAAFGSLFVVVAVAGWVVNRGRLGRSNVDRCPKV